MLIAGRLATVIYFLYFPVLWLTSKLEKPLPLPQSISTPVLKGKPVGAARLMEKA